MWAEQYSRRKAVYRTVEKLRHAVIETIIETVSYAGDEGLDEEATWDMIHDELSLFEYETAFWHFWMDCYHLKDWLKNDPDLTIPGAEIEEFRPCCTTQLNRIATLGGR